MFEGEDEEHSDNDDDLEPPADLLVELSDEDETWRQRMEAQWMMSGALGTAPEGSSFANEPPPSLLVEVEASGPLRYGVGRRESGQQPAAESIPGGLMAASQPSSFANEPPPSLLVELEGSGEFGGGAGAESEQQQEAESMPTERLTTASQAPPADLLREVPQPQEPDSMPAARSLTASEEFHAANEPPADLLVEAPEHSAEGE